MNRHYPVGRQGQTIKMIGTLSAIGTGVLGLFLLGLWGTTLFTEQRSVQDNFNTLFLFLFLTGWVGVIALVQLNMFSDVWVRTEGIAIQFLNREVVVPWQTITEIRYDAFGLQRVEVYATQVTLFHQLFFGGLLRPVFWLDGTMPDIDRVVAQIEAHAPLQDGNRLQAVLARLFMGIFPIIVVFTLCSLVTYFFPPPR
jgi:hypothetical protein